MIRHPWAVVVALLASGLAPDRGSALAAQLVVDPRGPLTRLTDALRLAHPGERILVRAGVYREPRIVVDRPVDIVGEGWPVFDGGENHEVFTVSADSVTIRGLVIRNSGVSATEDRAGIKLIEVRGCVIEGNRFENTFFAIYLAKVSECRIAENRIRSAAQSEALSGNAIHLWNSRNVVVERNEVAGHRDGIYLEFTQTAHIIGNRSTHNLRYGLHFMFSNGCTYRENTFAENGAGVAVMYSRDVSMEHNRFARNRGSAAYGLLLKEITDSRVTRNSFEDNTVGLYLEGANRVAVTSNGFMDNGWAVRIMADATDNEFSNNRFIGNGFDVATNSTSASSTFDENYWDHYQGYDLDGDGYGDVPFAPVRLFSLVTEQHETTLILLRSLFIDLLDLAERALPALTPQTLTDRRPLMRPPV